MTRISLSAADRPRESCVGPARRDSDFGHATAGGWDACFPPRPAAQGQALLLGASKPGGLQGIDGLVFLDQPMQDTPCTWMDTKPLNLVEWSYRDTPLPKKKRHGHSSRCESRASGRTTSCSTASPGSPEVASPSLFSESASPDCRSPGDTRPASSLISEQRLPPVVGAVAAARSAAPRACASPVMRVHGPGQAELMQGQRPELSLAAACTPCAAAARSEINRPGTPQLNEDLARISEELLADSPLVSPTAKTPRIKPSAVAGLENAEVRNTSDAQYTAAARALRARAEGPVTVALRAKAVVRMAACAASRQLLYLLPPGDAFKSMDLDEEDVAAEEDEEEEEAEDDDVRSIEEDIQNTAEDLQGAGATRQSVHFRTQASPSNDQSFRPQTSHSTDQSASREDDWLLDHLATQHGGLTHLPWSAVATSAARFLLHDQQAEDPLEAVRGSLRVTAGEIKVSKSSALGRMVLDDPVRATKYNLVAVPSSMYNKPWPPPPVKARKPKMYGYLGDARFAAVPSLQAAQAKTDERKSAVDDPALLRAAVLHSELEDDVLFRERPKRGFRERLQKERKENTKAILENAVHQTNLWSRTSSPGSQERGNEVRRQTNLEKAMAYLSKEEREQCEAIYQRNADLKGLLTRSGMQRAMQDMGLVINSIEEQKKVKAVQEQVLNYFRSKNGPPSPQSRSNSPQLFSRTWSQESNGSGASHEGAGRLRSTANTPAMLVRNPLTDPKGVWQKDEFLLLVAGLKQVAASETQRANQRISNETGTAVNIVGELRNIFACVDDDGSGYISMSELTSLLGAVNLHPTDDQLSSLMKATGLRGDELGFADFVRLIAQIEDVLSMTISKGGSIQQPA